VQLSELRRRFLYESQVHTVSLLLLLLLLVCWMQMSQDEFEHESLADSDT